MFWESPLSGVIVGFALSALLAWWLDRQRGKHERTEAARAVRRDAHARILIGMSDYITAINGLFVDVNQPNVPRKERGRREFLDAYKAAAIQMDHTVLHAKAFAAPGVEAAVRDLLDFGGTFVHEHLDDTLTLEPQDFGNIAESLLEVAGLVARADTDAQRDSVESPDLRDRGGRLSWIPALQEEAERVVGQTDDP